MSKLLIRYPLNVSEAPTTMINVQSRSRPQRPKTLVSESLRRRRSDQTASSSQRRITGTHRCETNPNQQGCGLDFNWIDSPSACPRSVPLIVCGEDICLTPRGASLIIQHNVGQAGQAGQAKQRRCVLRWRRFGCPGKRQWSGLAANTGRRGGEAKRPGNRPCCRLRLETPHCHFQ